MVAVVVAVVVYRIRLELDTEAIAVYLELVGLPIIPTSEGSTVLGIAARFGAILDCDVIARLNGCYVETELPRSLLYDLAAIIPPPGSEPLACRLSILVKHVHLYPCSGGILRLHIGLGRTSVQVTSCRLAPSPLGRLILSHRQRGLLACGVARGGSVAGFHRDLAVIDFRRDVVCLRLDFPVRWVGGQHGGL